MNGKRLGYWIITGLFALGFGWGAIEDLRQSAFAVATLEHLGYPAYLGRILGVFKLIGIAVVLLPALPRLKEWAYAGIAVDLLGAASSHQLVGDPPDKVFTPLMFLAVAMTSWALRPPDRVLGRIWMGWPWIRRHRTFIELVGAEVEGTGGRPREPSTPSLSTQPSPSP